MQVGQQKLDLRVFEEQNQSVFDLYQVPKMTMRESLVRLLELKLDQNLLKPLQSAKNGTETEDIDGNSDGGDDSNEDMGVPSNIENRQQALESKLRNTRNSVQPSLIKDEQLKQSIGDAID